MNDLFGGDVHLVSLKGSINYTDQRGNLYVALVICQSRRGSSVSDINLQYLQTGLDKVAQEANRLKGLFIVFEVFMPV